MIQQETGCVRNIDNYGILIRIMEAEIPFQNTGGVRKARRVEETLNLYC